MKNIIINVLKLKALILLVFFFYRFIFLLFNGEIINIFISEYHGMKTDLAIMAILLLLPFLLLMIFSIIKLNLSWFRKLLNFSLLIPILFVGIIEIVSIDFFEHWGSNFNHRALSYLKEPSIAFATSADHFSFINLFSTVIYYCRCFFLE